jgi:hypothetical protein
MDIVADSGTAMAYPSHTVYLGRDPKPDREKAASVPAQAGGSQDAVGFAPTTSELACGAQS